MRRLLGLMRRLAATFSRQRGEQELSEEMESLVALHAEALESGGLAAGDARREALRRIGGVTQLKETYRERAILGWLNAFGKDIVYAWRRLRQRPTYALTAIATLAIGIGAHTAVFAMIESLLLRPLPFHEPNRVVALESNRNMNFSYPDYKDIRDRNHVFSAVAATRVAPVVINAGGEAQRYWGYMVTGNYFELLGITPWRGRLLASGDDINAGAHPLIVISHGRWQREFGGRDDAIGKEVRVNGHVFTILGVTPPGFVGHAVFFAADCWVPFSMIRALENRDWRQSRTTRNAWVVARLTDGVTPEQATAELAVLAGQIAAEHPDSNEGMKLSHGPVGWMNQQLRGAVRNAGLALLLVSVLTMLVACANLSGLILAQIADRRKEFALRISLGAGNTAVYRVVIAEMMLLALAGAAGAVLLSRWTIDLVKAAVPSLEIPLQLPASVDWRVGLYACGVALATAVLSGLWPAWRSARAEALPALKDEAVSEVFRRFALRDFFVAVQVVASVVLVAGAVMMMRSFRQVNEMQIGVNPDGVMIIRFDLDLRGYKAEPGSQLQRRVLDRVRELPGVEVAALANSIPLSVDSSNNIVFAEGQPEPPESQKLHAVTYRGSPRLFQAMGTRLLEGREFNEQDTADSRRVTIVNQTLVDRLFGGKDAIGKRVRFCRDCRPTEIVGVVEAGRYQFLNETPKLAVWTPATQGYNGTTTIVVRSKAPEAGLVRAIRKIVADEDREIAVFDAAPYRKFLDLPMTPYRILTSALAGMGALAAFLCGLGLYAVVAYGASRRMRELGIRAALGAGAGELAATVVRRMAVIGAVSIGIGMVLAVNGVSLLGKLLDTEVETAIFGVTLVVVAGVAVAACAVPSWRAMRVQPMAALRHE